MTKIERFEDLICWQKARALTNVVYELTRVPVFSKDFELVRQIRGAATSAMSNVAEGFERWTRKEFIRFLDIAKGSAGEVRSQLYVALDQHYISPQQFESVRTAALETSKVIAGLIAYLSEHAGAYTVRETPDESIPDLPIEFCRPLGT
jgi:four helix bundle protein